MSTGFLQKEDKEIPKEFQQWIKEQWGWKKLPIGGVVPYPGTARMFKTGEWRDITPIVDSEKCTGCTMCYFICPDDAIRLREIVPFVATAIAIPKSFGPPPRPKSVSPAFTA